MFETDDPIQGSSVFLYKDPRLGRGVQKAYGYTARHKNSFWCTITLRSGNCEETPKGGQSKVIDRLSIKCFHKPFMPPKAMLKSKLSTFEKMEKSEQKRKICVGFLDLLKNHSNILDIKTKEKPVSRRKTHEYRLEKLCVIISWSDRNKSEKCFVL